MPFDKISLRQLFLMRILTGLTFLAIGGGLAWTAGGCLLEGTQCTTRFEAPAGGVFLFASLNFGALLASAGLMLLELTTKAPLKVAINVPFVAANFQVALALGLVAFGVAVRHAMAVGPASSEAMVLQWLCLGGFAFNLMFVVMTKLHWNFTENTGKALPTA